MNALAGVAVRVLGALAALLALFLVVGLLLPRRVDVTRAVEVSAPPEAVFPWLSDLERWPAWTPWGEVESRIEGPVAGEGATRTWDDPTFGSGSLTLTEVVSPRLVSYRALVEGGLRFEGQLEIEPRAGGARVTWTESVSWGWNPLMGWTGLRLDEAQGRQLEGSLSRLRDVVGEGGTSGAGAGAARDTVTPGAAQSP